MRRLFLVLVLCCSIVVSGSNVPVYAESQSEELSDSSITKLVVYVASTSAAIISGFVGIFCLTSKCLKR
ncbi:MAG: hypothetical protein LBJ98_01090 [Endomicrobium sp.]|nr:hypothetical protein [Endomicrobium sp.]